MIELSTPTHFPSFLYNPLHTHHFSTSYSPINSLSPHLINFNYFLSQHDGSKGRFGFESKLELPSQRSNSSSSQSPLYFSFKPQPSQTLLERTLHFFRCLSFSIPSFFPDLLQFPFLFFFNHTFPLLHFPQPLLFNNPFHFFPCSFKAS